MPNEQAQMPDRYNTEGAKNPGDPQQFTSGGYFPSTYASLDATWTGGNKKAVYDLTQGSNQEMAAAAKAVVNTRTPQDIDSAVRSVFGDATTASMVAEAQRSFSSSGNYTWVDLDKFIQNYTANPKFVGQATTTAYANKETADKNAQLSALMSPGSALYQQYFGEGGIVKSQEAALATSLKPSQTDAYSQLSRSLAARGLSTSGSLQAGQTEINKNYAQQLSTAFQNMQSQGLTNLTGQASSAANYTSQQQAQGFQDIANSVTQGTTNLNAQSYSDAMKKASGWSWLTPVLSAASAIAGQPWLSALIGAGGSLFGGGSRDTTNYTTGQSAYQKQQASNEDPFGRTSGGSPTETSYY